MTKVIDHVKKNISTTGTKKDLNWSALKLLKASCEDVFPDMVVLASLDPTEAQPVHGALEIPPFKRTRFNLIANTPRAEFFLDATCRPPQAARTTCQYNLKKWHLIIITNVTTKQCAKQDSGPSRRSARLVATTPHQIGTQHNVYILTSIPHPATVFSLTESFVTLKIIPDERNSIQSHHWCFRTNLPLLTTKAVPS